jgi:hypothetical protein
MRSPARAVPQQRRRERCHGTAAQKYTRNTRARRSQSILHKQLPWHSSCCGRRLLLAVHPANSRHWCLAGSVLPTPLACGRGNCWGANCCGRMTGGPRSHGGTKKLTWLDTMDGSRGCWTWAPWLSSPVSAPGRASVPGGPKPETRVGEKLEWAALEWREGNRACAKKSRDVQGLAGGRRAWAAGSTPCQEGAWAAGDD